MWHTSSCAVLDVIYQHAHDIAIHVHILVRGQRTKHAPISGNHQAGRWPDIKEMKVIIFRQHASSFSFHLLIYVHTHHAYYYLHRKNNNNKKQ